MVGSSGPQSSNIANPVARMNRVYAVYMDQKGNWYVAADGKPRSPMDVQVANQLTADEAMQKAQSRESLNKQSLSQQAFPGNQPDPRTVGSSGPQGASSVPEIAQSQNNTAQAVQQVVENDARDPRQQEAQSQADLGSSANLDDTWLAGRNQGAVQAVMNGSQVADPRQALNMYLNSQGLDTHANRGFLEQAMANYNPLYQIMNAGEPFLDPEYALLGAGNFASNLMGMSGNSMNRVDTQGIYDNIWSDAFRNFNSEQVDQTSGGPQAAYQRIVDSISALAPYMGQQNADYLLTKINTAYEDFLNRSTMGDGMQGEQDFLNFIMQFNPQDWY